MLCKVLSPYLVSSANAHKCSKRVPKTDARALSLPSYTSSCWWSATPLLHSEPC